MVDETWRPVQLHPIEGCYEASTEGRIRRAVGGPGAKKGYILTPHPIGAGYPAMTITVRERGFRGTVYVHDLVASAFLGPKPDGMRVHHKDHDKTNSRPENLEYVTHRENLRAAVRSGRVRRLRRCEAEEIRRLYREGVSPTVVGRMFRTDRSRVWAIGTGRAHRYLDGPEGGQR